MLLLDLLITLPFIGFTYLIHHYVVKLEVPLSDWNLYLMITISVIVFPVIEEFIFRFPLRFKRNYLARIVNWISKGWLRENWNSIFKYFLYLMIFLFGIVHLGNYDNIEPIFFLLSPLIIGSQLIGGAILSYCRIKLGFIWAIVQHGLYNFALIAFVVLFFHDTIMLNKFTENINLKVTELIYIDKHNSYYNSNHKDGIIYSIDANNISLFALVDSLQLEGPKPFDNTWISVELDSESGISKVEIMEILRNEIKFEE